MPSKNNDISSYATDNAHQTILPESVARVKSADKAKKKKEQSKVQGRVGRPNKQETEILGRPVNLTMNQEQRDILDRKRGLVNASVYVRGFLEKNGFFDDK